MTPRELKRELAQRRRDLRTALRRARREAQAKLAQNTTVRRAATRRRAVRVAFAVLLLVALLFIRCDCGPMPVTPDAGVDAGFARTEKRPVDAGVLKAPSVLRGSLKPQPRPAFAGERVASPSWVDDFRLQVSARGPRLAQCFVGSEQPGALRWVSSVDPRSGIVADHQFEPVGVTSDLSAQQRTCITAVLSQPGYKLLPDDSNALPNRVSLVIEF